MLTFNMSRVTNRGEVADHSSALPYASFSALKLHSYI